MNGQSQPGERGRVEWRLLHLSMQHNLPRKWRIHWEWRKIWIQGLATPEPLDPTNYISVSGGKLGKAKKVTHSELLLVCLVYPWPLSTSCWGENGREQGRNRSDAPDSTWAFIEVCKIEQGADRQNPITIFPFTFHLDVVEAPLLDLSDDHIWLHQPGKNRIQREDDLEESMLIRARHIV